MSNWFESDSCKAGENIVADCLYWIVFAICLVPMLGVFLVIGATFTEDETEYRRK